MVSSGLLREKYGFLKSYKISCVILRMTLFQNASFALSHKNVIGFPTSLILQ